jgi:hypothetical protein
MIQWLRLRQHARRLAQTDAEALIRDPRRRGLRRGSLARA